MDLLKYIIDNNIITKTNLLNKNFQKEYYIIKHNLFFNELEQFKINNDCENLKEAIYLIYYNTKIKYCICGKKNKFKKFSDGYNKYCSSSCANSVNTKERGVEVLKGMQLKGVASRKEKNNGKIKFSEKHILALSKAAKNEDVINKKRKTCKERYDVENPGVLGGRASKMGREFIENFIVENNLSKERCYYDGGGISNKEYYICKNINGKKYYFLYDLVVIDENKNPILCLEYNGNFHYTKKEMKEKPNENATPYKNSKTIKEQYEYDILKLETMKCRTENIYICWVNNRKEKIEKYGPESLYIRES